MACVYLGLGSNLGNRLMFLNAAIAQIASLPQTQLLARSTAYDTPPLVPQGQGPQDQEPYLNLAVHLFTELSPEELLKRLQQIELDLGRAPLAEREHWGPREIDIDLLLYDDLVLDKRELKLPHPRMHERWFVLKPLDDIAPGATHPVLGKTIRELLSEVEQPRKAQGQRA